MWACSAVWGAVTLAGLAYAEADTAATAVVCSCATEQAAIEQQKKSMAELEARLAEITAKFNALQTVDATCQTQLKSTKDANAGFSTAIKDAEAKLKVAEAKVATLAAENEKSLASQQEIATLKTSEATFKKQAAELKASYEKELASRTAAEKQLDGLKHQAQEVSNLKQQLNHMQSTCEKEKTSLKSEFDQASVSSSAVIRELRSNMQVTQERLDKFETTVYSSTHFWTSMQHVKRIGLAFTKKVRRSLERVVGADVIDLGRLQLTFWMAKLKETLYRPYVAPQLANAKMVCSNLYHNCGGERLTVQIDKFSAIAYHTAVNTWHQVLQGLDKLMNRLIDNLSVVDPEIRNIFPQNFQDKCYAFTFILLVGYVLESSLHAILTFPFRNSKTPPKSGPRTRQTTKLTTATRKNPNRLNAN